MTSGKLINVQEREHGRLPLAEQFPKSWMILRLLPRDQPLDMGQLVAHENVMRCL